MYDIILSQYIMQYNYTNKYSREKKRFLEKKNAFILRHLIPSLFFLLYFNRTYDIFFEFDCGMHVR